jgi:hypothetical protein
MATDGAYYAHVAVVSRICLATYRMTKPEVNFLSVRARAHPVHLR